jgi:hypothetical protein
MCIQWHENRTKHVERHYKDRRMNGEWTYWNSQGEMTKAKYKNGKCAGSFKGHRTFATNVNGEIKEGYADYCPDWKWLTSLIAGEDSWFREFEQKYL